MNEWDGHERRQYEGDMDWHQHKLKILSDMKSMQDSVKGIETSLQELRTDVSILKVKIGIMVASVSAAVSTIVGLVIK